MAADFCCLTKKDKAMKAAVNWDACKGQEI